MAFLTPQYIFHDVTRITPEFLRVKGIAFLVLDVDNTLTAHGSQQLTSEIEAWLQKMQGAGIGLMIASNNTRQRVQPFAQRLGLSFISFSCKPSPRWIWAAQKQFGCKKSQMALVGDQVFTDMLAGHLYGVTVLMVRPLTEDTKPTIRLKRKLEKPILLRYYKKGGKLL